MKNHVPMFVASLCGVLITKAGYSQGNLTPPGAPAPTMKTLDQIEPRTPISSLPFTIAQPGSYYLAMNLTGGASGGITISTNDVTLDLKGFVLAGGTGTGILVGDISNPRRNIAIRNGTIRGWSAGGVSANFSSGLQFDQLRVSHNVGTGIAAGSASLVQNCVVTTNSTIGIFLGGGTVQDCVVSSNRTDGIQIATGRAVNNTVDRNGGPGIRVTSVGQGPRIEGNLVTRNAMGLRLDSSGSVVLNNIVKDNTDNYSFVGGNQLNLLLSQIPESIDWPASVVLAGSLTGVAGSNGISVTSSDVTIDLAGHALIGVAGSLTGVVASVTVSNLAVRNGTVHNWGADGVGVANAHSGQYQDLRLAANAGHGLRCNDGSVVVNCTAESNGDRGILAIASTLSHCSARRNANVGFDAAFGCTVSDCTAYRNGTGISASQGCMVSGCTAYFNTADGISVFVGCTVSGCTAYLNNTNGISASGSTVRGCTANGNSNAGIQASGGCRVADNHCTGNPGAGIVAYSDSLNYIEGNNVTDNGAGITVNSSGNLIIRNTASGNYTDIYDTNYEIVSGNKVGTVVSAATSGLIVGSSGGNGVGTTDPWANLSF